MKILADTSVFLAVALEEPEKPWLIDVAKGCDLAAPDVLPYEVGNALSALVKRKTLRPEQAVEVWDVITRMPVELVPVDIRSALALAIECGVYAYDAYFLDCAVRLGCTLLTLDQQMCRVAGTLKIRFLEKP